MNQTILTDRIIKTESIRWKDLKFIQQDNFKEWVNDGDKKLMESLLKYQFIDPFKVWENEGILYCLDGKHRFLDLESITKSGYEVPELLPATFISCKNEKEAAELVLVYSSSYAKITQQGMYDFVSKYDIELPDMKSLLNVPEFSFERFEQKFDLFQIEDGEEPAVEIPEDSLIVKPGDLFELNGHRIICGSFTSEETVSQLMQGEKARIVNCDPPYNLPTNFFSNGNHKDFAMANGEMTDDEFVKFLSLIMQTSISNTVPGAIHYIFMDFRHSWHMTEAARLVYGNPQPKQICVWNKDLFANGSFYRAQHELCFIFSDERAKALWNKDMLDAGGEFYKNNNEWCFIFKNGDAAKHLSHLELKDRIRSNVWRYPAGSSVANPDRLELKNHPTPKPVAMIADAILDTTNDNDLVIDWFLGSGTALIAAEHTKRRGRFTEIEPLYVQGDIIRYLNYCDKRSIKINFAHLNGNLTIEDFRNEQSKLSNAN